MRRILLYGLAYPGEVYGGLVAVIFSALGLYFGLRWARTREVREVVVVREVQREVRVPEGVAFSVDAGKLKELGITPREHEILGLIATGLSNREIGERLFVSENTVKTHSSRLFEKLGVNRRVQAVVRARELGLTP
jgi:ATP/maltotriose-dependent transcriptional regulator MalT